jgi:rare lipoprotein A
MPSSVRRNWPGMLAVLLLVTGCAEVRLSPSGPVSAIPSPPPDTVPPPSVIGREQVGRASWYGEPHHGRRTSSGEVYDMNGLTAAHRTLPLGTRIRVTNLATGRSVDVRINDRGPFVDGRILDLSRAAASRIGPLAAGIFRVRLTVLTLPEGTDARAQEAGAATQ